MSFLSSFPPSDSSLYASEKLDSADGESGFTGMESEMGSAVASTAGEGMVGSRCVEVILNIGSI